MQQSPPGHPTLAVPGGHPPPSDGGEPQDLQRDKAGRPGHSLQVTQPPGVTKIVNPDPRELAELECSMSSTDTSKPCTYFQWVITYTYGM
jgi:hypothetical protein